MSSAFERLFDTRDRYRGNIFWENRLDCDRHMLMPALVVRCVLACRSLVFCVWSLPASDFQVHSTSQCVNQLRIRSNLSTSSQGSPLRDSPWLERG